MNWIFNKKQVNLMGRRPMLQRLILAGSPFVTALLFATLVLLPGKGSAQQQELTEQQKQVLEQKIKMLLKSYEQYNQFSTDGVNLNSDYIKEFIALFEKPSKTGFFNELSPSGKGSFETPELYVNFVRQFYRQGLDVTINRENITMVEFRLEKGKYYIYTYVPKKVVGIYNNQGIYRFNNELCFIFIAHPDDKGELTSVSINGIVTKDRYAQIVSGRKGKGLYVGVGGMFAQTSIFDNNINSSGIWTAGAKTSINPQFELTLMFTRGFGIGTGVKLATYQTAYTINNFDQLADVSIIDEDGDSYQPELKISQLIDTRTISSMDIPILLKFRMGKGKVKLSLDMGMIYSLISKGSFTLEGSATRAGYYSVYNATLTDIPEYGFGTYNYSADKSFEMELPSSSMSAYANLGLMFQITPKFLFKIGSGYTYGISPLPFNSLNADNYFNYTLMNPANNSVIRSTGFDAGLIFKLF